MKIAIVDILGLCYDGDTLHKQGLGGSESAVILMSRELVKLGFEVTVFNNCLDSTNSSPGIYDGVRYIDNVDSQKHSEDYAQITCQLLMIIDRRLFFMFSILLMVVV